MINREMIEGKFDIIERNLKFLTEFKNREVDEFLNSYRDIQAVKYSLLETIEACIDIANHIISVKGYRRAEEYSEMFTILAEEGLIDADLSSNLADMASFRNLLVHRYGEVNNERVLEIIKSDLGDIREFEKCIERFLRDGA